MFSILDVLLLRQTRVIWQTGRVDEDARLLDQGFEQVRQLLPEGYELKRDGRAARHLSGIADAVWLLREPGGVCRELVVAARTGFTPRTADLLVGVYERARQLTPDPTIIVVAPWLSPRSREVLAARGLNYVDLTGNVLIRVPRPAVYLRLQGADRDPTPQPRGPVRLTGARANRLVRLLVDVAPPYRMIDLARASGLSAGYVSRSLDALDEQALIRRENRAVVEVDWAALLRGRASSYDLLRTNDGATFIAPQGAGQLYTRLQDLDERLGHLVVTGSYAATAVAPIAAPAQLALYTDDPAAVRRAAGLLPADRGADVVLLRAVDASQTDRPRIVDGVTQVGLSQLVLDCLAGNGRLPAEGEAVLGWMRDHVNDWRLPDLATATGSEDLG